MREDNKMKKPNEREKTDTNEEIALLDPDFDGVSSEAIELVEFRRCVRAVRTADESNDS
jgi:hypothetical protein